MGKSTARSVPFHAASAASSSACTGREPTIRRAEPDPAPHRSRAAWAAAIDVGVLGEPEVVVGRERHDRAAVGRRASPARPGGVEVAGRAPAPGAADGARPRRRPSRAGHASRRVTSAIGLGEDVDDALDLVRGDRERAASARPRRPAGAAARRARPRRAHPPAPPQPVGRRRQLDAAHQAALADVGDRRRAARPRASSSVAQLRGACAHVGEHVPLVEQLEVAERDRGGQRVPAVGVAVVERALAQVGPEERVEDPLGWPPWPTCGR